MAKDLKNETKPLNHSNKDDGEEKTKVIPKYLIDRDVLTIDVVNKQTGYESREKSFTYFIQKFYLNMNLLKLLKGFIPIMDWLPKYSIRQYLIGDIIAGITVAVMHIPQGMAYGILAGVTASVGLYMAFFPVLIYLVFGTSRHISMGTFGIMSVMTLSVVQKYATTDIYANTSTEEVYTALQVVIATAIMTGVIHFLMFLLGLGTLASLLSEPLVNGFTTAAAVHVVVNQIKDVLGITIPRHKGAFKIGLTIYDAFANISKTNYAALIFSIGIIAFMVIMNEVVKPYLSKKCRFPLPAELIAVVGGNLISRYGRLGEHYNIHLVGHIPTGLPEPQFPPFELLSMVAVDAIAIAIVSYSIVASMSLIFARKHGYEISANQELFALSLSNIVGGIFSCMPIACSLSRSLIQEQTGGMTQIASVVSSLLILTILLWIGPFFETLPKCVLAGIIIVALKGMFTQAKKLKTFAKQGKMEVFTWIFTFFGVVLIDIDIGLLIGIFMSLLTLYIKGCKPYGSLLGTIPGTGIYVDLNNHKTSIEVPNVKIFRYAGSINFATRTGYKKLLYDSINFNSKKIRPVSQRYEENEIFNNFDILILDLSTVAHIDLAGCKTLTEILQDMDILGVRVYLANPTDCVYDALAHYKTLGEGSFDILPSVHDAVLYSKSYQIA